MTRKTDARPPLARAENRRGSPEAVEKRRAARLFNSALLRDEGKLSTDGRTERRRRRLLDELAKGTARGGKRGLKPVDVLARVQELLELGEPIGSIQATCATPRPVEATPEVIAGIRRLHDAYAFPVEAYAFVGLDAAMLREAGILPPAAGPGLRSTRQATAEAKRRPSRPAARG